MRGESFQVQQRTSPRTQRWGLSDIRDYIADKANIIPGFRMFTIVLGVNPINGNAVDRSPGNVLRAIIEFIPFGGLVSQALDNYGIFDKIGNWVSQDTNKHVIDALFAVCVLSASLCCVLLSSGEWVAPRPAFSSSSTGSSFEPSPHRLQRREHRGGVGFHP